MKLTSRDLERFCHFSKKISKVGSLAGYARDSGIPLGTLKTRVKKLVDKGIPRERAIEIAVKKPIGPQGRPRNV